MCIHLYPNKVKSRVPRTKETDSKFCKICSFHELFEFLLLFQRVSSINLCITRFNWNDVSKAKACVWNVYYAFLKFQFVVSESGPWFSKHCQQCIHFSFIHSSMALQPFVGPWPLLHFHRTPWTCDQPVARPLPTHTEQHKHRINAHRHPCLEWDSNPRSQLSSERRQFMPYTARPLWSEHPF
jgi:hypothetical protein